MEKVTGLVLEVGVKDCLVLGPGNEYLRVMLPKGRPQIGDVIEGQCLETKSLAKRPVSRIWAYVASILITLMLGGYKVYADTLAPTAYISVDMAPSIELVLNSKGKVVRARSYNLQGANLLRESPLDDQTVNDALQTLITKALSEHDIPTSEPDTIIMTYTAAPFLNEEELNREVADILERQRFNGQLLSQSIDRKFRAKAADSQLSPGQQLVLDLAISNNVIIPTEDLKRQDMSKFLQSHNLKIDQLLESATKNPDLQSPHLFQIGPTPDPSTGEPAGKPADKDPKSKVSHELTEGTDKSTYTQAQLLKNPGKLKHSDQESSLNQVATSIIGVVVAPYATTGPSVLPAALSLKDDVPFPISFTHKDFNKESMKDKGEKVDPHEGSKLKETEKSKTTPSPKKTLR